MDEERIKTIVREGYANIARQGGSCCAPRSACCGGDDITINLAKKGLVYCVSVIVLYHYITIYITKPRLMLWHLFPLLKTSAVAELIVVSTVPCKSV